MKIDIDKVNLKVLQDFVIFREAFNGAVQELLSERSPKRESLVNKGKVFVHVVTIEEGGGWNSCSDTGSSLLVSALHLWKRLDYCNC